MFFLSRLKGIKQNTELEKQLMNEIRRIAGVTEFPFEDAKKISEIIASGYNRGIPELVLMSNMDVLEKYPKLSYNWDDLMIKYKKLGLFPKWQIVVD